MDQNRLGCVRTSVQPAHPLSARQRERLPDFLIVGAKNAGANQLSNLLRSHPDVFMPSMREPSFFIDEGNWALGLDWYRSLFAGCSRDQIAGEASASYTAFPLYSGAPARIAAAVPGVKLIYLIREPLKRMESEWLQYRADALEDRPLRESLLFTTRYMALSHYATQLERYLEHIDRQALLIIRWEDLKAKPLATMREICLFLGIDPPKLAQDYTLGTNNQGAKIVPRRRTIIAMKLLRQVHRDDLALRLKMGSSILTHRSLPRSESHVDDDVRDQVRIYLRPDMQRLREIVGPQMDLWGYA
jgi:Sulfotransferase domain